LKPKVVSKDISKFAEAKITLIQNILFALEDNTIHQRSKPEDPSTMQNPHRFRPPTDNPRRYRWKEEEAPHLHTAYNKSKV
jgi:hypothetical protein